MRIFTFGESMGMFSTIGLGDISLVDQARLSTGGSEANFAVGVSRLGAEVTWLSRVGDDGFGRRIIRDLRSEGVNVLARIDSNFPTGLMIKSSPRAGKTEVDYYRANSAASHLGPQDFTEIAFEDYDHVHLSGITPALSRSCLDATQYVATEASRAGCSISFDLNYRSKLWQKPQAQEAFRAIAKKVNFVIAGSDEAEILTGYPVNEPGALKLALDDFGIDLFAIKKGPDGATLRTSSQEISAPSLKVQVVDTVGAGDAFSAGLIWSILSGADHFEALETAIAAGSLACTHPGDWQGNPTIEELRDSGDEDPVRR